MEVRLRPAAAESSDPRRPAAVLEITDAFPADQDPFGLEQRPLERRCSAIPSKAAGCRNHPVTGNVSGLAVPHDVADGARRARPARELRHVPVGRDLPDGDTTNRGQHAGLEVGHIYFMFRGPRPAARGPEGVQSNSTGPRTADRGWRSSPRKPPSAPLPPASLPHQPKWCDRCVSDPPSHVNSARGRRRRCVARTSTGHPLRR